MNRRTVHHILFAVNIVAAAAALLAALITSYATAVLGLRLGRWALADTAIAVINIVSAVWQRDAIARIDTGAPRDERFARTHPIDVTSRPSAPRFDGGRR